MKVKYFSPLLLGTVLLAGAPFKAGAQALVPPPPAAVAGVASGPSIQFATPNYDFGRLPAGQVLKYSYVFTNTGHATLRLTEVRPSCGCTAAGDWTRQVEPGQTGVIPIQFSSANFSGPVHKSVTVSCNASNQPSLVLQLTGTVWKAIDVSPLYVYFNLSSDQQTNEVRSVRIINNDTNDVTLAAPEVNNRSFTAELKTIRPGREFEVQVKTVPPVAPGTVQSTLTLRTSLTNLPVISVSVIAIVPMPIVTSPSQLLLPAGPLTSGSRLGLTVRNNGATPVTVSEPSINLPGVDIQMQEVTPGRVVNFILSFPAGFSMPAGQRGEFTVKTTHPKHEVIKVPIIQMARTVQQPYAYPPQAGLATNQVRAPLPQPQRLAFTNQVRAPVYLPQFAARTNQSKPPMPPTEVPR
jgi:hypothetical protein